MIRRLFLNLSLMSALTCSSNSVLAQVVSSTEQIPQAILVNGRRAEGVILVRDGNVQNVTCTDPHPYLAVDQSSSGWACFDQSTGTWLLQALPPQFPNVNESSGWDRRR